jgi:hypothetical protein
LTITSASNRSAAHASTAGSTFASAMNETSATIRSGRYGSAPQSSARALTRSRTVTRGSSRSRSASSP